nr:MAG TPA: hypothetical protein [Caudoviricetes sp.]
MRATLTTRDKSPGGTRRHILKKTFCRPPGSESSYTLLNETI